MGVFSANLMQGRRSASRRRPRRAGTRQRCQGHERGLLGELGRLFADGPPILADIVIEGLGTGVVFSSRPMLCPLPHQGGRVCHRSRTPRTQDRVAAESDAETSREVPSNELLAQSHGRKAMMHSQHAPLAVVIAVPTNRTTRFESQLFRILLCRRLRLLVPLSSRTDVAACSIHLAQRVLRQGSWVEGAILWSVRRHRCAGKQVPGW